MKKLLALINNPVLMRWLAIGWTIVILIGCLTPHDHLPDLLLSWSDKLQHAAIFGLFTVLWIRAGWSLWAAVVIGILFGGLIEVLQYILPINRSADWRDLLADAVGVVLGAVLVYLTPHALQVRHG